MLRSFVRLSKISSGSVQGERILSALLSHGLYDETGVFSPQRKLGSGGYLRAIAHYDNSTLFLQIFMSEVSVFFPFLSELQSDLDTMKLEAMTNCQN